MMMMISQLHPAEIRRPEKGGVAFQLHGHTTQHTQACIFLSLAWPPTRKGAYTGAIKAATNFWSCEKSFNNHTLTAEAEATSTSKPNSVHCCIRRNLSSLPRSEYSEGGGADSLFLPGRGVVGCITRLQLAGGGAARTLRGFHICSCCCNHVCVFQAFGFDYTPGHSYLLQSGADQPRPETEIGIVKNYSRNLGVKWSTGRCNDRA